MNSDISNESGIRRYFNSIMDRLRNFGVESEYFLQHINLFVAYKLLDSYADKIGFNSPYCKWSNLLKSTSNTVIEDFNEGYDEFHDHPYTKELFKNYILIRNPLELIETLNLFESIPDDILHSNDLFGDLFEIVKGSDSAFGSYYTPREICDLAFDLIETIKPDFLDEGGKVLNYSDFYCGSGGFALSYMKKIMKKHPNIDWNINFEKIHCVDIVPNSVCCTLLNLLIMSHSMSTKQNVIKANSFTDNLIGEESKIFPGLKIQIGATNPPFGGDEGFDWKKCSSTIQNSGISVNKKNAAAVELVLEALDDGGVQAIILDSGFFTNATPAAYPKLRERLVKEYEIHYLVEIPRGAFRNTTIETKMLVFEKSGRPTKEINVIDTNLNSLGVIKSSDMKARKYSMSYRDYITAAGFNKMFKFGRDLGENKIYRLGEIITYEKKALKLKAGDGKDEGKYRFYSCSKEVKYCDQVSFQKPCIIVNGGGSANVRYDDEFAVTDHMIVITTNKVDIYQKYVYYYLKDNLEKLEALFAGTGIKNITKQKLGEIPIILPPFEKQREIADSIDQFTTDFEEYRKLEVSRYETLKKFYESSLHKFMHSNQLKKLGEVCSVFLGKRLCIRDFVDGEYDVYGGGIYPTGKHNEYNIEENTIIMSKIGSCGSVFKSNKKIYLTDNGMYLNIINKKISDDYVFYYLKTQEKYINSMAKGTAQKILNINDLNNYVAIPMISQNDQKQFVEIMSRILPELEECKNKIKKLDDTYIDYLKLMIPKFMINDDEDSVETEQIEAASETVKIVKETIKIDQKKKSTDWTVFTKSNDEIKKKFKGAQLNDIIRELGIEKDEIINKRNIEPKIEYIRKHLIEKKIIIVDQIVEETTTEEKEKNESEKGEKEVKKETKIVEQKKQTDWSIFSKTNEELKKKYDCKKLNEIIAQLQISGSEEIVKKNRIEPKLNLIRNYLVENKLIVINSTPEGNEKKEESGEGSEGEEKEEKKENKNWSIFSKSNEEVKKKNKGEQLNKMILELEIEDSDKVLKGRGLDAKIELIRKHLTENKMI